jgi:hypothetical protein
MFPTQGWILLSLMFFNATLTSFVVMNILQRLALLWIRMRIRSDTEPVVSGTFWPGRIRNNSTGSGSDLF